MFSLYEFQMTGYLPQHSRHRLEAHMYSSFEQVRIFIFIHSYIFICFFSEFKTFEESIIITINCNLFFSIF